MLAAVASCLEARRHGGQWLLRIEDIDPPREEAGAAERILRAMEILGFEWDGPASFQSASRDAHAEALACLERAGHTYRCGCSRSDLAGLPGGPLGPVYPGYCRTGCDADEYAIRVRTAAEEICFEDRLQGRQSQSLETASGDFIVHRRDGLVAYHLAVVVDDALQGVTDVVRGIDLMPSTPRQIWLQRLLGYPVPGYCHVPVAVDGAGKKLSKRHGAEAVPTDSPSGLLANALSALGQHPPVELASGPIEEVWEWALAHWDLAVLEGHREVPVAPAPSAGEASRECFNVD